MTGSPWWYTLTVAVTIAAVLGLLLLDASGVL